MATFASISATGKSIERVLNACFKDEPPVAGKTTKAVLIRTDDFATSEPGGSIVFPALSIFLYRVEPNKVMRAAWSAIGSLDGRAHLPLDLHYLLTAWADNAEHEHQVLGKAMECLESLPILSGPILYPSADWAPNEAVQLVAEDVGTDSILRTFDSLQADFRLSVAYLARVVRLDGSAARPSPPVTTVVTGSTAGGTG